MSKLRRSLGALAAAVVVVSALGSSAVAGAAAAPKIDKSATLRFASALAPSTWDPHTHRNIGAWQLFSTLVYDRLAQLKDIDGVTTIQPMLATGWEVSKDGLTVDFNLRKDVKFQDGSPFNAAAVKANIDRAKNVAAGTVATYFTAVDSVDAVNDTLARFHLNKKDASLLYTLAYVPGDMVSPAAFGPGLTTNPVGSGPYKFVSQTSTAAELTRNDNYWDLKNRGMAAKLSVNGIADVTARYNLFKSGQLDVAQVSPTQYTEADNNAKTKQANFNLACTYPNYILEIHTARKPFDNVDVRRAINIAIDRETMHKSLLPYNPPLTQVFPKGMAGHVASLDKNIPYNVSKAKGMIDKAGATGATMNIIFPATDPYPDLATIIQQQLSNIGLKVNVQGVTPALTVGEWRKGSYDGYVGAFSGSPDPATQLQNWIEVENFGGDAALPPGLTEKAAKAKDMPVGSKQRDEAYQEISKMLVDSPVGVTLFQYCNGYVSSSKVVNMDRIAPTGNISWTDLAVPGISAAKS